MGVPGLASYYYKKYNKTSELSIDICFLIIIL
jgi:hypothetical protein